MTLIAEYRIMAKIFDAAWTQWTYFVAKNYLHTSFKKLIGDSNPPRTPLYNQFWERFYGEIEERRRQVASLLAQSMTESEIAQELNVDQSTISRDVKALKQMSQQFVFDFSKVWLSLSL